MGPARAASSDGGHRRARWPHAVTWALLVVGLAASVAGAALVRKELLFEARLSFSTSASDVSKVVAEALERDENLTAAASALVLSNPDMSNKAFRRWFELVGVDRYPGARGYGFIERVPAARLNAYVAKARRDLRDNGDTPAAFTPSPAGNRAQYCLSRLGVWMTKVQVPPGVDLCALSSTRPAMARAAQTGRTAMLVLTSDPAAKAAGLIGSATPRQQNDGLGVISFTPVYAGGVTPATVAARRAALVGWTVANTDVRGVLESALGARSDVSIRLVSNTPGDPRIVVAETPAVTLRFEATREIGGILPWLVEVSGPGPSDETNILPLLALVGGVALTMLLFLLIRVLVSSRRRALALVAERTGQLRHQALHDTLTNLPNRALIVDRAEQMLARAVRQREPLAALFIDIDNFKEINDTFGHGAGDELLKAVAARLSAALRGSDSIGRLGGDEFVVLAEGMSLVAGPELVAERLLDVLGEPFQLASAGGVSCTVSASIGIAAGDRGSAEELLRDADVALHEAKAAGRNRFVLFEQRMQEAVESRWAKGMDLRAALENGEFFLLYQPTFAIDDLTVTGVEALLRWHHPTRGVIPPGEFVPLLEETGLIVPVGRWVLRAGCAQVAGWRQAGYTIRLAVNLSALQLDSETIVADVADAIAASGLDPQALTVEITESALMTDTDAVIARLNELKALGIRIAIDDFGTGYSSLAYLRRFPVDVLKIDRSFISGFAESDESAAIVHTLVQLGKTLGLETVAEGIEHQRQLDHLKQEHCDTGQGFLIAKPLTPEALREFLETALLVRQDA